MISGLQKFIRDLGWSFTSLMLSAGVHFLLRIILARFLGVGDVGLYSLAFTAYSFGLILSGFGIGSALIRYAAEYKNDFLKLSSLLSSGSAFSLATGIFLGVGLYLLSPVLAVNFFDMPEMTNLLRIVAFGFPFIALQKATLGFLNGLRRMRAFAIINIAQNVLVVGITTVLVVMGYGVNEAVIAMVLPVAIVSLISLYPIRAYISKPDFALHGAAIKALMVFGLYVMLVSALGTVQGQINTILLGHYMTEIEVGYYTTALIFSGGIMQLSGSIQMITGPVITEYWVSGDTQSLGSMINRVMKLVAVFTIPIAFSVAFFAEGLLVMVFGESFSPAGLALQILMLGAVFGSVLGSVGSALASTAFVKMVYKLLGVTLICNIVLNILLIPRFGMAGAAIANSATIIANSLLGLYFIERLIKIKIDRPWFARILLVGSLIAGITYLAELLIRPYICVPVAICILILVLYKYFVSRDDISALRVAIIKLIRPDRSVNTKPQ